MTDITRLFDKELTIYLIGNHTVTGTLKERVGDKFCIVSKSEEIINNTGKPIWINKDIWIPFKSIVMLEVNK